MARPKTAWSRAVVICCSPATRSQCEGELGAKHHILPGAALAHLLASPRWYRNPLITFPPKRHVAEGPDARAAKSLNASTATAQTAVTEANRTTLFVQGAPKFYHPHVPASSLRDGSRLFVAVVGRLVQMRCGRRPFG